MAIKLPYVPHEDKVISLIYLFFHLKINSKRVTVATDMLNYTELECGPMPNVMAALPNIGGALCSMPQSLADAHYQTAVQ